MAEIAFLISLISADKGISHIAAEGLRYIAQAEGQPNAPVNSGISDEERVKRHSVYEELGDPNVIVFGKTSRNIAVSILLNFHRSGRAAEAHA